MNNKAKLLIALTATAAGIFGSASNAFAGEGGAAGAAAFRVEGGAVTGVAVAASVGKQDAFAGAFNDIGANMNSAMALGSAGVITMTTLNATSLASVNSAADTQLGIAQGNELDTYRVNINAVPTGTVADFDTPAAGGV
jgi:hypothetical protein